MGHLSLLPTAADQVQVAIIHLLDGTDRLDVFPVCTYRFTLTRPWHGRYGITIK